MKAGTKNLARAAKKKPNAAPLGAREGQTVPTEAEIVTITQSGPRARFFFLRSLEMSALSERAIP
jgi:hypothetical protein